MQTGRPDTIGFLVGDLARLFRQRFEEAIAAEGLEITAGEARTLFHASASPGIRQSALAELMRVEPMTLVNFLDKLEARGLVARELDPQDRRAKLVQVTTSAGPVLDRVRPLADAVRAQACRGIDAAEVERTRAALLAMRRNLSKAGPEQPS